MENDLFYKDAETLKQGIELFKKTGSLPKPIFMLAPLAGYSDLPFRNIAKKLGADITVSEMISAHALANGNKKTEKMAEKSPIEVPYALQISGSKEDVIKSALEKIDRMDGVDIVDFNCGCPAPKVYGHGNGSALLKELDRFVELLKFIRLNSKKSIFSVKVRLGFDRKIPEDLAHAINESGVDYCVVHARTKTDMYKKERVDYDSLSVMESILKCPMIANGDIDSYESCNEIMKQTNAQGAMIGRAALRSPWIFWQLNNKAGIISSELKKELVLEHLKAMKDFYGDPGLIMFRKNLHAYASGHDGARKYREEVNSTKDYMEMKEGIIEFFGRHQTIV